MLSTRSARRTRGFTLIEIMVVIVILGVLAALVVPRVLDRPDEARGVAAKSDIAAILQALKLYRLDNQRYPTADQGLAALVARPETDPVPPNWKPGGYLEKLRNDPWGRPYQYLNPGLRGEIDVLSLGADGNMATRRTRNPATRGFTLVEILVVIAILALGAGISAVMLSGDERTALSHEARRFAGAVEYAADRAKVRHETLGVSADGGTWRFWRRAADGRWSALSDDPALAPRALPSPVRALPQAYAGGPLRPETIVPLRASGRNEPFAFVLANDRYRTVVSADPLGRIAVGNAEPFEP